MKHEKEGLKGRLMHGDHNKRHEKAGKHSKADHWDGSAELGTKGERWEGTGAHCRSEAAARGFGKK